MGVFGSALSSALGGYNPFQSPLGGVTRRPARGAGGAPEGYSTQYEGVAPGNSGAFNLQGLGQWQDANANFQTAQGYGSPATVNQQRALADLLMGQAQGKDSYSAEQLRQGTNRLMAQQQSFASAGGPGQAAMRARLAGQNMGTLGAQMSGNAALAGIQERNAAAQSLGGVLGQTRGQDIQSFLGSQQLGLSGMRGQQEAQALREQLRAQRYGYAMGSPSVGEVMLGGLQGLGGLAAGGG